MPSLKALRSRIRSVRNTQKITKAMKLVAAAKLRRAQDAVTASRPYSVKMRELLSGLAGAVDPEKNPLFRTEETPRRVLLIPMTSDRGLCGGFNSSILRRTELFLRESKGAYEEVLIAPFGRKGRDYFRRRNIAAPFNPAELMPDHTLRSARALSRELVRMFSEGEVDEVYLVYNEFKSALTQVVQFEQLLPLSTSALSGSGTAIQVASDEGASMNRTDYLYEPDEAALLGRLLPMFVETQIFRALLESVASEMGARMTAMDNASKNASELLGKLTLSMNRIRQAIITTELMEITAGAESLKG